MEMPDGDVFHIQKTSRLSENQGVKNIDEFNKEN